MDTEIVRRGVVMLGCGKMGSAMLSGWLVRGLLATSVWVIDPAPSDWLQGLDGLHLNTDLPGDPAMVIAAVKPQLMVEALTQRQTFSGSNTVFLSIAAGVPITTYEGLLGAETPIIRAMPNTPAAIGRGVTAIVGNRQVDTAAMDRATELLSAIGQVVRLEDEGQMDAVTAVSGSGPAYVFHMIEAMAAAGEAEGLARDLALDLAVATVSGAAALAAGSDAAPGQLRENVTSPGGTTAAGLDVLMNDDDGLGRLMRRTIAAAAARSRELGV